MKAVLIQMNVSPDKVTNLAKAQRLIEQACTKERPDLIMLPECFTFYGGTQGQQRASAEPCPGGEAYTMLSQAARHLGVFIHCGSLNELDADRVYNTSLVFDRTGREIARYRKIHLFSITAPDGVAYDEAWLYGRGEDVVVCDVEGLKLGCTICYDLRFPELYRALVDRGAQAIAVPAAFTLQTGKEHWEPLLRARAIETQCYILAAGQEGTYEEDGRTLSNFGHSMVVEPWGTVIARRGIGEGLVAARLDVEEIVAARARIQLADHRVHRAARGL